MQQSIDTSRKAIKKMIERGDDKSLQAVLASPEGRAAILRGDRLEDGWLRFALEPEAHGIMALEPGRIRCIQLLAPAVKRGFTCEMDVKKGERETVLILAIQKNSLELVKILCAYCDPLYYSSRSEECALAVAMLHCQSFPGRVDMVHHMLDVIDPQRLQALDRNGDSLLCKAAAQCPPELFHRFLAHIDPKITDKRGWTPLMHAARLGHLENLNTLLPLSDVHAREHSGRDVGPWAGGQEDAPCRNALDLAIAIEHVEVVDRLSEWADEAVLRKITDYFGPRVPRASARREALELADHLSTGAAQSISLANRSALENGKHPAPTSNCIAQGAMQGAAESVLRKKGLRL